MVLDDGSFTIGALRSGMRIGAREKHGLRRGRSTRNGRALLLHSLLETGEPQEHLKGLVFAASANQPGRTWIRGGKIEGTIFLRIRSFEMVFERWKTRKLNAVSFAEGIDNP